MLVNQDITGDNIVLIVSDSEYYLLVLGDDASLAMKVTKTKPDVNVLVRYKDGTSSTIKSMLVNMGRAVDIFGRELPPRVAMWVPVGIDKSKIASVELEV